MSRTSPAIKQRVEDFSISRMTEHDLLDVVEIEEQSRLSRWGWSAYYAEMQTPNREFMLVARARHERDQGSAGVIGYIVARVVTGELHINNVAIRAAFRRRGIAGMLLERIIEQAKEKGGTIGFLEVRAGNLVAQALYRKYGFRPVARRRNYYSMPREDAVVMSLNL